MTVLANTREDERESVRLRAVIVPHKVCFMDLTRLDEFIKQLNHIRTCAIPGGKGELIPVHVNTAGQVVPLPYVTPVVAVLVKQQSLKCPPGTSLATAVK